MKQAILVDVHGTILDQAGKANELIITLLKRMSTNYDIVIFTAHNIKNMHQFKEKLITIGVPFADVYSEHSDKDDVDKKLKLYHDIISHNYDVKLLLDNNKKVIKAFKKIIPTMRYKDIGI